MKHTKLTLDEAYKLAVETLSSLIAVQSFSKQEENAALIIQDVLSTFGYSFIRQGNNVWSKSHDFIEGRKTLMLNSHIDTVKPGDGWVTDPLTPLINDGKLSGLGSNDAGGSLVSLLATFLLSENLNLNYNRVFVASAEEEISGTEGIASILKELDFVDAGIVGEPTQMEVAVAEKGLMVLDCVVAGKAGHAARTGGVNAITKAFKEIEWFHSFQFPDVSETLGPVKMTVTVINAGKQHNVIPDKCSFVVDCRINDCYSNKEALAIIEKNTKAQVLPRSTRLNSSGISPEHPIVKAADKLGIVKFGSPTTSDQSLITLFPTIKMGPGDSNRSHTANEFIMLKEIKEGIKIYCELLSNIEF